MNPLLTDPVLAQEHIPKQGPNVQEEFVNSTSKLAWTEVESKDKTQEETGYKLSLRIVP